VFPKCKEATCDLLCQLESVDDGDFLSALNVSFAALGRKILLFVDNCAAHSPDTSPLRNVMVVFYPPNCTSVIQPLDLDLIKCFQQVYRKQLV
jgi:hypothetical protein